MGILGNLLFAALLATAPPPEIEALGETISIGREIPIGATDVGPRIERGRVLVRIPPGFHANANPASRPYLVPLTLVVEERPGLRLARVEYPRGRIGTFFSERLRVYEGEVVIEYEIALDSPPAPLPEGGLVARLDYQLCDSRACFSPGVREFVIPIEGMSTPGGGFQILSGSESSPSKIVPAPGGPDFQKALESGGWPLVLVLAFLGGVLLNLTPCVYPVLPITLGYLGSGTHGRWAPWRYLLGMALTFAVLGLAAAIGGAFFGSVLQSPWVLLGLAALLLYLAGSSMGWYEIPTPTPSSSAAGPFVMGATAGLVAAPCVGPIVVGFLLFLSTRAAPPVAFAALLAMGVGMALPQAILAAGVVRWGLPRPGPWLDWAKKAMGLLLPGAAIWILLPLLGPTRAAALGAIWALVSGAYLGWFEPTRGGAGFRWIRRGVGLAYGAVALLLLFGIRPPVSATGWEPFDAARIGTGRPAIVDVRADWCLPCLELERWTFSDPEVSKDLEPFVRLRLDVTTPPPPALEAWLDERKVIGVPTVMLFDGEGQERRELRLLGFEEAGPFRERLAAAQP